MSESFPTLQRRYAAFLASVDEAKLRDLLDHLNVLNHDLQEGDIAEPDSLHYQALMSYLDANHAGNPVRQLEDDICGVEALIEEHGDRRLK